jgi:coenzyme F420-dependent glucose-6-phosphate dehydrogenase
MVEFGYALSSEEHTPLDLVNHARSAEDAGFTFALISDHFHPWIDQQGQSPFVWAVLGGIAQATTTLRVGTGVTCPIKRIHPIIVAQAAATAAAMLPDRFFLGLGTGENLNEHILGTGWPEWDVRSEMLDEAIAVIRRAWRGRMFSHRGTHYTVQNARIYTLPSPLPPIYLAAGADKSVRQAARAGDGLIGTGPDTKLLDLFQQAGGSGPRIGQLTLCWASSVKRARQIARTWWPNVAVRGEASQELPDPAQFEQLAEGVTEDDVAAEISCGPDVEVHLQKIQAYLDAGYDQVYLHQVGPDQEGFMRFASKTLLPAARRLNGGAAKNRGRKVSVA